MRLAPGPRARPWRLQSYLKWTMRFILVGSCLRGQITLSLKTQSSHRMISTQNKSVSIHTFIVSGLHWHWIIELRELQTTRLRCIRAGNTWACFPDRILGFSGAEIPHNCDTSACVTSHPGPKSRRSAWPFALEYELNGLVLGDIISRAAT